MATSRIKIVQGNDLPLCKKLTTLLNGVVTPIDVTELSELHVLYGMGSMAKAEEIPFSSMPGSPIIHFRLESTQIAKLGSYNVWIVGKYGINDVVVSYGAVIEVIEWSAKSNAGEYIYTEEQALDDSIFIPAGYSDEELETIKRILRDKTAQAEQAKQDADNAKKEADEVAYNAAHTLTQDGVENAVSNALNKTTVHTDLSPVMDRFDGVDTKLDSTKAAAIAAKTAAENITIPEDVARKSDIPTDYAKESKATANREAIESAIRSLLGSNTSATLTAIYTIVGALHSGLTTEDKEWIVEQLAAIDLSSISSRLDNDQYGLSALKTAISNIQFDKSDLAKSQALENARIEIITAIGTITFDKRDLAKQADLLNIPTDIDNAKDAIIGAMPSIPTNYATEETATSNKEEVLRAIAGIDIDTSKLAKQGDNQEATNSAIFGKVEGIATDIKALDADVLQGKRKLAAAITQKGVRTAYTESLSDMAINVSAIPQTTYTGDSNFDAMVMPCEYMWNVYKIAENLIGNNPYPYANRFFVAEYYRGYDSLVLSGADAYLTCDGDYYEVMGEQCIHTRPDGTQEVLEGKDPNHIWHDEDNGKMNRYVVFFFQADTYTFSNTTAAICPRRVAISGNCASFIVTGENRLTDVWVLGTLGNFSGGTTGDSWSPAQVIRNYREHNSGTIYNDWNGVSLVMPELERLANGASIFSNNAKKSVYASFPKLKVATLYGLIPAKSYGGFENVLMADSLEEIVYYHKNENYLCFITRGVLRLPSLKRVSSISTKKVGFVGIYGNGAAYIGIDFPVIEEIDVQSSLVMFSANNSDPSNEVVYGVKLGCKGDRTKTINVTATQGAGGGGLFTCDVEIGDYENIAKGIEPRWKPKQPIYIDSMYRITAENIALHILDRLADNTDGETITIKLNSTNLATITNDPTYSHYLSEARAKNYTIIA